MIQVKFPEMDVYSASELFELPGTYFCIQRIEVQHGDRTYSVWSLDIPSLDYSISCAHSSEVFEVILRQILNHVVELARKSPYIDCSDFSFSTWPQSIINKLRADGYYGNRVLSQKGLRSEEYFLVVE